jgi:hypothetical protein
MAVPVLFSQHYLLKNLVAASTTFQEEIGVNASFVGTATGKAEAQLKVHRVEGRNKHHAPPRAIVRFNSSITRDEGVSFFVDNSELYLLIDLVRTQWADTPTGFSAQEEEVWTKHVNIINDIISLQGTGEDETDQTYLKIESISCESFDYVDAAETAEEFGMADNKILWYSAWEITTI